MTVKDHKIGDKVLVMFQRGRDDYKYCDRYLDEYINTGKLPLIGEIISSKMSDDLSYHGSPYYEEYYTVKAEDGKTYSTSGNIIGTTVKLYRVEAFFRRLNMRYEKNKELIANTQTENSRIRLRLQKAKLLGII